jgi:hypothetical protein
MVAVSSNESRTNVVNPRSSGLAQLHATRFGPVANQAGIPEKYGIQGIPQPPTEGKENGGLPALGIGSLAQIGSNGFLPSDEISQTLQATDDFTRIYGKHSFKMGVEYQNVKFNTLQPGWSHGQFNFGGGLTDIPNQGTTVSGVGQMVLPTTAFSAGNGAFTSANTPGAFNYSGGSDGVFASNINTTHDQRIYFATYFQDDWKVTPGLTLNFGVRWDYFGPINESSGGQANFVPTALPSRNLGGPTSFFRTADPPRRCRRGIRRTRLPMAQLWFPLRQEPATASAVTVLSILRRRMESPFCRPTAGAKGWCRLSMAMLRRASDLPTR